MSDVFIASVGLATAQGSAADLASGALRPPARAPYLCRPAVGVDAERAGSARFAALAGAALAECGTDGRPPLFVGSCNGGAHTLDPAEWAAAFDSARLLAGTPYDGARVPIASASCASGMHALYLAAAAVRATGADAIALAVDILSPASRTNFDSLRLLAPAVDAPWSAGNRGFVPGEAGVALRLTATPTPHRLGGPVLGAELAGLVSRADRPDLVCGQGTGPHAADRAELAALAAVDRSAPLTTPAHAFGHTLGASGLLSIALVCLDAADPYLRMPAVAAVDGRPLLASRPAGGAALIACRALNGACAAAGVGAALGAPTPDYGATTAGDDEVFHIPAVRNLAAEAIAHRPAVAPDALVVHLDVPLEPPARARLGRRLLPTAVLEMTPGALPMAIATRWGYRGPALCLVGGAHGDPDSPGLLPSITALANLTRKSCVVYVRGEGEHRRVEWAT